MGEYRQRELGAAHPLGGQPEGGRDARWRLGPHDRERRCPQQEGDAHAQGGPHHRPAGGRWRVTGAAIAKIEAEIPYPLGQVVTGIGQALRRKSFHDRIAERLAKDPAWG
jgi:hypothetical protein